VSILVAGDLIVRAIRMERGAVVDRYERRGPVVDRRGARS
jgi:hypothetical protein